MPQTPARQQFQDELAQLEIQTLGALDMVCQALDRALEVVAHQDVELASMVIADDDRIDGRYLEVHQGILSLLALQAPVAGDLRIVAALLHVIKHVERMGDQCVNMAKLVPLAGHEPPADDELLAMISRMGELGRSLVEHYVSRPTDDVTQIHGNIYIGRVENVLPGMEAAFVDIATPKNAVLYRGDVQYDPEDVESKGETPRIEEMLKPKQLILCQVTKNPIGHKGARLTQEVSLPGRFVVLVPNSSTYGISKRLPDNERKRLRQVLDRVKPAEHGVIVRTAAEGVTAEEIERDLARLIQQWTQIEELAAKQTSPGLLYREPEMAVRFIREEFNADYRAVIIDDEALQLESLEPRAGVEQLSGAA